ncbi:hypothetical protein [Streptomyces mangrovisoli]|uniref:Uncharacterized protein n=1 Tax=Streptomyces mangrovisoli TaxID=1428628 RepID=A0A1J4P1Z2_9ACTN|nr:hypothetical protein [Streptomyces mangrovisoli]OIJ68234.1 hypothetical protein WN71_008970 [Streptomyces mangrovisoli]
MTARNRRLPRHRSWPLTRADLGEGLGGCLSRVTDLRFLEGDDSGTIVLGAEWIAPAPTSYGRGVHPDMVGFRVDVHPVATADRAATRVILRERALPRLRAWIAGADEATETWLLTPHRRLWRLVDGRLVCEDDTDG